MPVAKGVPKRGTIPRPACFQQTVGEYLVNSTICNRYRARFRPSGFPAEQPPIIVPAPDLGFACAGAPSMLSGAPSSPCPPRLEIVMAEPRPISRRDFIRATAQAGAVLSVVDALPGPLVFAAVPPTATRPGPSWADRPMRWAAARFRRRRSRQVRSAVLARLFPAHALRRRLPERRRLRGLLPDRVPLHYRSKWLGDGDPFGELVSGCRKLGMIVDRAHRSARRAPGRLRRASRLDRRRCRRATSAAIGRCPDLWVTCAPGSLQLRVHDRGAPQEIVTRYQVDGIFSNRWAGSGMCYCEHCRDNFQAYSGLELPRTTDPRDPARTRLHRLAPAAPVRTLAARGIRRSREINPNARFIPNAGGGALSELDMKTVGELAPSLFADRQARRGLMPPWANGKNGKEYRATMGAQADRRHLQRRRGGTVPLERFGAGRTGDPAVGAGRHRQRPAPVVHQVLRDTPSTSAGSSRWSGLYDWH